MVLSHEKIRQPTVPPSMFLFQDSKIMFLCAEHTFSWPNQNSSKISQSTQPTVLASLVTKIKVGTYYAFEDSGHKVCMCHFEQNNHS